MSSIFFASILFCGIAMSLGIVFLLTKFLGPNDKNNLEKNSIYESGVTNPIGSTKIFFSLKFYLVAILFIIFDVEILFMLPWAVNVRELGMFGLFEMLTFMFLLFLGLVYVYNKGALQWD